MKVNNITIINKIYDSHADGYLILGKNKKKHSLKKYVVGWVSRHEPDKIRKHETGKSKFFADIDSAKKIFNKIIEEENQSNHDVFIKDWQKKKLYEWEDKYVLPYAKTLDKKQIEALIKKVSKDYHIKTPKIEWFAAGNNSYYDNEDHLISLGMNDDLTALHEMAHVIHEHMHDRDIVANHPPAFAWKLIELYKNYMGLDMKYLVISALHSDILEILV